MIDFVLDDSSFIYHFDSFVGFCYFYLIFIFANDGNFPIIIVFDFIICDVFLLLLFFSFLIINIFVEHSCKVCHFSLIGVKCHILSRFKLKLSMRKYLRRFWRPSHCKTRKFSLIYIFYLLKWPMKESFHWFGRTPNV